MAVTVRQGVPEVLVVLVAEALMIRELAVMVALAAKVATQVQVQVVPVARASASGL
jgi:hypothetical protein